MGAEAIPVPPELQQVLREFTKAVLRDMPQDVLAYSKDYFIEKAQEQRMGAYALPPSTSRVFAELPAEMKMNVENVFKRYDADADGSLTIDELEQMVQDLGGLFGFTEDVNMHTMMALLDADGNKVIDWQEWSHVCAVWLSDMRE